MPSKRVVPLAVAFALAACNGNGSFAGVPAASPVLRPEMRFGTKPIQHVVFVLQENRSFNNLFLGYPGARTQKYGYDSAGDKIVLQPANLSVGWDIDHFSSGFFAACHGRGKLRGTRCEMDGWDKELTSPEAPKNAPYTYVPETQVDPYWKMANQYVLADRTFSSNLDGSFIAHQFAVAAYASRAADLPGTAWGCEGGRSDTIPTWTAARTYGHSIVVCFDNPTIASEADTAGVSWRFYSGAIEGDGGIWSSYQADSAIYNGSDWSADVISPPSQFLADVAAGKLANVTWITPTYENSDHPGLQASGGPAWVASIVDAVGTSRFWNSSAIFIMWDDWGGLFDPVKPPYEDYAGLGFRVPLLMISPYAKRGYVTHVQYETASVLRFIEDTFGLPALAASDARAHDPAGDAFDYNQKPRAFKRLRGSMPYTYWRERDRAPRAHGEATHALGD